MQRDTVDFRKRYDGMLPILRRGGERLEQLLKGVVLAIEDKDLVRARVLPVRIKEFPNLQRKAEKKRWNAGEAMSCGDLVGGRVVCSNLEDVRRFAELLKEHLPSYWGEFEQCDVQDYIQKPNIGGYRAVHLNFRLDVFTGTFQVNTVPCEVQIRSRLQDTWAELTHDDIYKQPDLPEDLQARAKDLAEVLTAADRIASAIRSRAVRETTPPAHRPDLQHVSADGLAYCFREVFGRSPADYAVRLALNLCDRLHLTTLENFSGLLMRPEFRDDVAKAYRSILPADVAHEDVFLAALYAAAKSEAAAIKWIEKKARRERDELEEIATREVLSSLPDTIEDLIEALEDPRTDTNEIELWAEALGATNDCAVCGTTVIPSFSFAEAVVQYYEVDEDDADFIEQIEDAVGRSGLESGGWGDGSLCAYHNEQQAKND